MNIHTFENLTLCFVTLCFALLVVLVGKTQSRFSNHSKKNTIIFSFTLLGWLILIGVLSRNHFYSDFSSIPPKLFMVIIIPLLLMFLLLKYSGTSKFLAAVNPSSLIYIQSFRIVVEIGLWYLYTQDIIPIQMTLEGQNFDILVGISAPIIGLYFSQNRKIVLIWNIIGICILLNIVIISILSTPTPLRVFMNEPANRIVAEFPYVYLPGFLVPIALYMHTLSIKRALQIKS